MNYDDPRDHRAKKVSEFLKKMSAIESSSGQDTDHKTMEHGIHEGHTAVGNYGIMPNTALEIGKRHNMGELQDLTPEQTEQLLKDDAELAERIAATMASRLLNKNDEESANYMWQMGHNRKPAAEKVEAHPRTKKFRVLGKNDKK